MNDWFDAISATCALPSAAAQELQHRGFTVIPDAVPRARLERLSHAYDAAMSSASGADLKIGSTTTRLGAFVNRGEEFDALYIFPPLLDACCRVIGRPFKLSSLHGCDPLRAGIAQMAASAGRSLVRAAGRPRRAGAGMWSCRLTAHLQRIHVA